MATDSTSAGLSALKIKSPGPHTRFRLESLGLFAASCLFITASHLGGWFDSLDRLVYDAVIARVAAPQAEDVVLVSIDDQSLHQYGPWPWSRTLQARLLRAINATAPRAILLDIIYSGERTDNDQLTAAAAEVKNLALPMMVDTLAQGQQHIEVLPYPELLDQADILGHVQIERDADAIVRGTYLFQGVGEPHWPHASLAVAQTIHGYQALPCTMPEAPVTHLTLKKCGYVRIPFAGPPGTYPQVSAAHLLGDGQMPVDALERALTDKVVLVGITALGGSDWVTSPLGSQTSPLSGVEFNANLLSALVEDSTIVEPPAWLIILIGMLLAGIFAITLPRLRPKQALGITLAFATLPLVGTMLLLAFLWVSLPLANVTIATALIYPLWSWRRHEIAWSFIQDELNRIEDEEEKWQLRREVGDEHQVHRALQLLLKAHLTLAPDRAPTVHRDRPLSKPERALLDYHLNSANPRDAEAEIPAERLARQIESLQTRAHQLRQSRDIGLAGLDRMSSGAIIISDLGEVQFINKAAVRQLAWQEGQRLLTQLEQISTPLGQNWQDVWHTVVIDKRTVSFESTLNQKPIFVVAAPLEFEITQDFAPSWVMTLADLSDVREAQAQREEALAFLSHDLRSPLTSILALIRQSGETDHRDALLERIHGYTQKGIATSDQFLQLSRLQLNPNFEKYSLELEQLIHNAIEQVFFLAREKDIEIHFKESGQEDGVWIDGNGELLERALVNLLGNAIKYSRENTSTTIELQVTPTQAVLNISDQGYGIPEDELQHIFEPFFRSAEPRLAQNRGSGLGLRFVKTVIERHQGEISVSSIWGQGTVFQIRLSLDI